MRGAVIKISLSNRKVNFANFFEKTKIINFSYSKIIELD